MGVKNLVFTSAGDHTNFDKIWLDKERNYDVWVVYYGDNKAVYNNYKSKVDYIERRKGFKFQNFEHIYKTKDLSQYERFFILDDDIVMSTEDINEMFRLSKKHKFWICGPTFKPQSRISHNITINKPKLAYRYTNYIEVNTPLFTKEALDNLMKVFDSKLIGWGIDHLYIWANGWKEKKRFALIDLVPCINPKEKLKGGKRELERGKNWDKREDIWNAYEKKLGIPKIKRVWYSRVKKKDYE